MGGWDTAWGPRCGQSVPEARRGGVRHLTRVLLSVTLPVGQDKPEFVKRRVRKLLTAGVVSALACMVKSENPALTNSCRELISRCECAGDRSWVPASCLW